ncbi:MAG: hypothetical protein MZV49_22690 [Rhodopseudomonas palustris]|nr:hypothetical protein [Rhodopseudomonas palustris]
MTLVLERAARARRQDATACRSASLRIDAGPTVFTMRWVFEAPVPRRRPARSHDHVRAAARPRVLARHAWNDGEPSRPARGRGRALGRRRSAPSAGAAEAASSARSPRARAAILPHAGAAVHPPACEPEPTSP